jgi:hypothetical protein
MVEVSPMLLLLVLGIANLKQVLVAVQEKEPLKAVNQRDPLMNLLVPKAQRGHVPAVLVRTKSALVPVPEWTLQSPADP